MSTDQRMKTFPFLKWLTARYLELEKKTIPHACKLIDIVNKNSKKLAKVQLAGSLNQIEIEIEKVIEHNLFEYFSSRDKKTLFSVAYNKEQLKLSDHFFCPETKKEMIVLSEIETGNRLTISAENLSTNDNLICQISSKDAKKVGFLSGIEYMKRCFKAT